MLEPPEEQARPARPDGADGAARRDRDAMERALVALNHRERSVAELTAWLLERDYPPAEVDAVVTELTELGVLDDERYARLFAEDKRELAGWGPERIEAALRERGIERSLIAGALAGDDHEEQLARAAGLLADRGKPLESDRDRDRALGFLTRRGYAYEVAHDAIRAVAAGPAAGDRAGSGA